MPQISKPKRGPLSQGEVPITDKGDLCFLITVKYILPRWFFEPRWKTISQLRHDLVQEPDLAKLKSVCRGSPFADIEIVNQAALAFLEFYRRVGANYEDAMARKNGDVYAGVLYSKSAQLTKGE